MSTIGWAEAFYFSGIAATTLGMGDVLVEPGWFRALAVLEPPQVFRAEREGQAPAALLAQRFHLFKEAFDFKETLTCRSRFRPGRSGRTGRGFRCR